MSKKICTKCGNELDIEDEFCENCGKAVKSNNSKKQKSNVEYDVELSIQNINVYGKPDGYTKTDVEIPTNGKTITVNVPNSITTDGKLRLKGLGYEKPNGTKGDVYLNFEKINYHFDRKDYKKSELKSLKCPSCGATLDYDEDDIDIYSCKYCRSTVYFDGMSDEAYKSKTKIKRMKHDELMADKKFQHDKDVIDKNHEHEKYKINQEYKKEKRNFLFICIWFLAIFLLIFIFSSVGQYKSNKQEEELQLLVEEVMDLVEDKDYDEACLKAKSIIYTENWSSEIEEKWDKKRKETINYIIKKEKKDKGKSNCKAEKDGFLENLFN